MIPQNTFEHGAVACFYGAGGIIPLAKNGTISYDPGHKEIVSYNANGARRVTRRKARAASWEVSGTAPAGWVKNAFALCRMGGVPYFWCSPKAQVFNLLPGGFAWGKSSSPAVASSGDLISISSQGGYPTPLAPVRPGLPVTASCFAQGSGAMNLVFYDVAGSEVGRFSQDANHEALSRFSISVVAPEQAVTARISARGFILYGGPALTWTDALTEYHEPMGCASAVISEVSESSSRLGKSGRKAAVNFSFKVLEVG